jgi:predicted transcriptional regulator
MGPYIVTMGEATSIQVSRDLLEELKNRKMYDKESYEDIIRDLLEDTMELSEETKKHIEQSKKDFEEGKTYTLEEVEKRLEL